MPNDNRSQSFGVFDAVISITANGSYPMEIVDTAPLSGIAFYLGSIYLADGVYRLAFDESDNGIDWSELEEESVIGSAVITQDLALLAPLSKCGVFSCKRYLRPKIVATEVTVGVGGIGYFTCSEYSILPEVS